MSYRQQGYRPPAAPRKAPNGEQIANPPVEIYRTPYNGNSQTRRKSGTLRLFVVLLAFALISTVGVMGYRMYDTVDRVIRENTFYPGVYIDGLQLHGKEPLEVLQILSDKLKGELNHFELTLLYGECVWGVTRETLGMTDDAIDNMIKDEINKAFMIGRDPGQPIFDRYNVITALRTSPYEAHVADIGKDFTQVDQIIREIKDMVYIAPRDATQEIDYNLRNPLVNDPGEAGLELDEATLRATIDRMAGTMESGTIQVPTKRVSPSFTDADFSIVQIADVSTTINRRSTDGRIKNVERGCEAFNGMTVEPGKIISFNSEVGKRTRANGFHEALEIVSGEYTMGIGGGICQVSTTLYQAVIQAGLEVVERHNHGIPVDYTEKGADATVTDDSKDFRFKNNTDAPIYITARVVTSRNVKSCEFQIFGRPNPDRYYYTIWHEERVIPIPDKVEKIWDYEQRFVHYMDQTHEVAGKVGFKVDTYLTTRNEDGSFVGERLLTTDTYQPVPNKVYVGVDRR